MPIKYCCVNTISEAGNTKLGEHPPADEQPTLADTLQKVFASAKAKDFRRRCIEDKESGIVYHTLANGDGRVIGCVTTRDVRERVAFAFLEAVEELVRPANVDARIAKKILQQKAEFYSDPRNDKLAALNADLNEVIEIMRDNLENVIIRGDRINNMYTKSVEINRQTHEFESKADELKNKLCWRNAKLAVMVFGGVGVFVLIIVMLACNPNFSKCK